MCLLSYLLTKVLSMAGFGNAGLPQRMLTDAEATDAAFNP